MQLRRLQRCLCGVRADRGVADCHAESGLEGCYFAVGKVVHRLSAVRRTVSEWIGQSVHALEGPVLCSEVQYCGPVVGEVFGRDAAGAGGGIGHVGAERAVQRVSSHELMEMGRSLDAWIHDSVGNVVSKTLFVLVWWKEGLRVYAVDGEL